MPQFGLKSTQCSQEKKKKVFLLEFYFVICLFVSLFVSLPSEHPSWSLEVLFHPIRDSYYKTCTVELRYMPEMKTVHLILQQQQV